MKRILKLLAHLYPSTWRNRYAAEYEALLDDATPRPQDAFNVLWEAIKMHLTSRSFVRVVLPCTIGGALIATAISFAMQPRYVSQTLITVTESAPIPKGGLDHILLDLRPSILDRNFLASVIQKYALYPRERAGMPLNGVIDKMLQSIEVRPLHSSPAKISTTEDQNATSFAVYFVYSDPYLAQLVEGDLTSRFVKEALQQRINAASDGHPKSRAIFRVLDAPSLPTNPIFPKRGIFAFGGLLIGFLCGLILATILPSHHNTTSANG